MSRKYTNDEIFTENSFYSRKLIKRRLIEDKIIKYECSICCNIGIHQNKLLILQLDHIDGDSHNNTLENLRFLCPNCHSQTETYAGKATKGKRGIKRPRLATKNFYQNKLEFDKIKLNDLKEDIDIRFGEWGWKSRLGNKLNITSQKVTLWLKRVDPLFLEEINGKSSQQKQG